MAQRRCLQALTRQAISRFSSSSAASPLHYSLKTLLASKSPNVDPTELWSHRHRRDCYFARHFSSSSRDDAGNKEEGEEDDDDDDDDDEMMGESSDGEDSETTSSLNLNREYSTEEKEAEAAAIGYTVIGPLQRSDRVFKPYEPVFAVVQIGSHQFKVSNGDCVFTERLKFCEVNDKLILNKVLLLGSSAQTIVGRPTVPDAVVHAVVEEHALDAKVIIFKKKRRKNYRRTKGHRQELTKLRITDIQGIEKPELKIDPKPEKADSKTQEKVPVAA